MGAREDDEKAYTTSEGMVGRSFRRGVRKGLSALTGGLVSGGGIVEGTLGGAAKSLGKDAVKEYGVMRERQKKHGT